MEKKQDVAAVVEGVEIYEADITAYIEGFRSNEDSVETDAGWATYLTTNGYTAESMRQYVIENIFIPKVVIENECANRELYVTDEELDAIIAEEREYYESRYGSDSWSSVLSAYGYDESTWRDSEEERILTERLMDQVVGPIEMDDTHFRQYLEEHLAEYNGKHSYFMEYNTQEEAQEAVEAIRRSSRSDELTYDDLVDLEIGPVHDAGWSSIAAYNLRLSQTYISALNAVGKGEVSEPVEITAGKWTVIYCDDAFSAPATVGEIVESNIPAGISRQARADAADQVQANAFQTWLAERLLTVQYEIFEMPSGLPYDVNITVGNGS